MICSPNRRFRAAAPLRLACRWGANFKLPRTKTPKNAVMRDLVRQGSFELIAHAFAVLRDRPDEIADGGADVQARAVGSIEKHASRFTTQGEAAGESHRTEI
jgi:hypothetical protein